MKAAVTKCSAPTTADNASSRWEARLTIAVSLACGLGLWTLIAFFVRAIAGARW